MRENLLFQIVTEIRLIHLCVFYDVEQGDFYREFVAAIIALKVLYVLTNQNVLININRGFLTKSFITKFTTEWHFTSAVCTL